MALRLSADVEELKTVEAMVESLAAVAEMVLVTMAASVSAKEVRRCSQW
jgi:hypothetical protein